WTDGISARTSRARDARPVRAFRERRGTFTGRLAPAGWVRGASKGAGHGARTDRGRREELRAPRSRRRRLPDGREVVVHEAGRREAALPLLQRRRIGAWNVQGPRDHALDATRAGRRRRNRRIRDRGRDVV